MRLAWIEALGLSECRDHVAARESVLRSLSVVSSLSDNAKSSPKKPVSRFDSNLTGCCDVASNELLQEVSS